jgi:hypothetical protein
MLNEPMLGQKLSDTISYPLNEKTLQSIVESKNFSPEQKVLKITEIATDEIIIKNFWEQIAALPTNPKIEIVNNLVSIALITKNNSPNWLNFIHKGFQYFDIVQTPSKLYDFYWECSQEVTNYRLIYLANIACQEEEYARRPEAMKSFNQINGLNDDMPTKKRLELLSLISQIAEKRIGKERLTTLLIDNNINSERYQRVVSKARLRYPPFQPSQV